MKVIDSKYDKDGDGTYTLSVYEDDNIIVESRYIRGEDYFAQYASDVDGPSGWNYEKGRELTYDLSFEFSSGEYCDISNALKRDIAHTIEEYERKRDRKAKNNILSYKFEWV